jgi:hypothetical protein
MKLVLGVIDQPYLESKENGTVTKRGTTAKIPTRTTGDVAERLEATYEIMGTFAASREQAIADSLADTMAGALENLLAGAPPSANVFGTTENFIQEEFHNFLDNREMDGRAGIPTKAALLGKSSRKKSGERGEPRASFEDTMLYRDSMVAEVRS